MKAGQERSCQRRSLSATHTRPQHPARHLTLPHLPTPLPKYSYSPGSHKLAPQCCGFERIRFVFSVAGNSTSIPSWLVKADLPTAFLAGASVIPGGAVMQTFPSATRRPLPQQHEAPLPQVAEVLTNEKVEGGRGHHSNGACMSDHDIFNIEKMRSHHTTLYYTRVNNPPSLLIPRQEHPPHSAGAMRQVEGSPSAPPPDQREGCGRREAYRAGSQRGGRGKLFPSFRKTTFQVLGS